MKKWTLEQIIPPLSKSVFLILTPFIAVLCMLFPLVRETVSPILFGLVAAYILMPVVHFSIQKLRLPRTIVILIIYILFASIAVFAISRGVRIVNYEVNQLLNETSTIDKTFEKNLRTLPDWGQGVVSDVVNSAREVGRTQERQPIPLIRGAFGRTMSLLVFLISTFYFLKDEKKFSQIFQTKLGRNLHTTIQNYFRGQIFLIFFMTVITWVFLTILGIKYAFLLAIFTGFAEIVPLIGPISAGSLAVLVAFLSGATSFGQPTSMILFIIIIGYILLRQIEDFFVIPYVMSRSTKLHPLLIIFFTLLGERLYGFTGLLLAVPFIATYKVIIEYVWEHYLKAIISSLNLSDSPKA